MNELSKGCTLKHGKYKIIRTLGRGSFGITYLATTRVSMDGQLGKMEVNANVAIKEFFMSDLNSRSTDGTNVERTNSTIVKNYLNKFRREAENLSKLQHPNIVKVLEVFDEKNTTYYVMEFIDGENLDEYIKRKGKLSIEESLAITFEICKALSYMHEHKMLHLDLKPKNIMRDTDGHIRLIDFGLAKQYNDDGEPESSTTLGLGTPGYAPIEQAHYKQDGTFPVTLDIYAVGASLYKMLTGKTPPESSSVLNDGLPHDALTRAGVNENVIAIVEKAMSPIKKDRYQTTTDLSKTISKFLSANNEQTEIRESAKETIMNRGSEIESRTLESQAFIVKDKAPEENELEDRESSFLVKYWKYGLVAAIVLLCTYFCYNWSSSSPTLSDNTCFVDSDAAESFAEKNIEPVPRSNKTIEPSASKEEKLQGSTFNKQHTDTVSDNSSTAVEPRTTNVCDDVDEIPSFPGGEEKLYEFLAQNTHYPADARENGVQGRVIVTFIIEADGTITDVEVVKSTNPVFDEEAKRVIRRMPKWEPGKQKGSAVRSRFNIPITFRLSV